MNEDLPATVVFAITIFLGNVISKLEAHTEETIRSILFESIQSFSPFILHFVHCFNNCLLLPLVDVLILMDPNGSSLQVINPIKETTMAYDEVTSSMFDTVQAPCSDSYGLAAYLPTCKRALWFFADETQFQSRSATAQGTRPGTDLWGCY